MRSLLIMLSARANEVVQTFHIVLRPTRRYKWIHGDTISIPHSEVIKAVVSQLKRSKRRLGSSVLVMLWTYCSVCSQNFDIIVQFQKRAVFKTRPDTLNDKPVPATIDEALGST